MKMPEYVAVKIMPDKKGTSYNLEVVTDADFVKVVRCKDCKHKDVLPDVYGIGKEALYCHAIKHYVVHDFFCKYGEKVTDNA